MASSLLLKLAVKGNTKELMEGIHTSSNKNAVDTIDNKGRTLLQLAAKEGHATCVKNLLAAGCDFNR